MFSEGGDVSVGRERSSQRFPLLDAIASAFGFKKGGVQWMGWCDVIGHRNGIVKFL